MKKIILSLAAIVAVGAVAGYGSYALWSDTETSTGNSITADKLDLVLASVPLTIANVHPGQTGSSAAMTAKNDSNTVNGTLTYTVTGLVDNENGCVEPESNPAEGNDLTCGTPGAGLGELSGHVKVGFIADLNGDGTYETTIPEAYLNTLSGTTTIGTVAAGVTASVQMTYTVDNSVTPFADNIFMTDSSTFDVNFNLTQI
ncbi:MAG: SipW-dependent-type signal peptide-containing protein [Parcubacteria group bacterium]|jgi:predicted ribosomally synthesized peptide with SipW-like signal peptide